MWRCKGLTLYKYSYCDVRHILNFDNTTPCSSNVPNARNWLVFTTFFCSFWCLLFSEGTRLFIAKKAPPHRKSHKHDVFHSFWHSDAISQRYATCAALFFFFDIFLEIKLCCFPTVQSLGSGSCENYRVFPQTLKIRSTHYRRSAIKLPLIPRGTQHMQRHRALLSKPRCCTLGK
jgi:hypothetical protein